MQATAHTWNTVSCSNSKWLGNIWQGQCCWLSPVWSGPPRLGFPQAYLSRLESGWEEAPCPPLLPLPPVPDDPPADCRFPDKSFSTAGRFPVRAASRSSCSFPIADPRKKSKEARGREGKRGGGVGCGGEIPVRSPLSPDLKLFLNVAKCGEETKASSAAAESVRPDLRMLPALTGVKSFP